MKREAEDEPEGQGLSLASELAKKYARSLQKQVGVRGRGLQSLPAGHTWALSLAPQPWHTQ